ncbi:MAG: TIGR00282 family metallophosphoesterase [Spirochaetaceae bacterium]
MGNNITALILGDVFGTPGIRALFTALPSLRKEHKADIVIVNGENAADGLGITPEMAEQLFSCGVDAITTGNHVWHKREIIDMLNSERPIIRPANYPPSAPGRGETALRVKDVMVGVVNLQGRERMYSIDCPFRVGKDLVKKMLEKCKIVIVDFHAEDTEEKESLSFYLDGLASAVVGTHTHTHTADEKILPEGTAYITDIGMTGPRESVIGSSKEISIQRSLTQMPLKMEVSYNRAVIQGVKIVFNSDTGKASKIERIEKISIV